MSKRLIGIADECGPRIRGLLEQHSDARTRARRHAAWPASLAVAGNQRRGGTLIMGEWQPAVQLNPFYTTSFADFEAIQRRCGAS